jgi:hypothetical protein
MARRTVKVRITLSMGITIQVIGSMTTEQVKAFSPGPTLIDTRYDVHEYHNIICCDNQYITKHRNDD